MSTTTTQVEQMIRVGTQEELKSKGVIVVHGTGRPIAVFAGNGQPVAVDNRCPHMGFPMHKGTVKDGIVTCHWHEARFDLHSGCTFDLFADDLPAYDTQVSDGVVYVASESRQPATDAYYVRRLHRGMQQNISLIQGKAIIGLLKSGTSLYKIVGEVAQFGSDNHDVWQAGMTSLTAVANLYSCLDEETAYYALFKGVSRVAADCAGAAPRRPRHALETDAHTLDTLKRWMRHWTLVRHRDGAERTFLTAIENDATDGQLTEILFSTIMDRPYANTGHVLDFANKTFELLELIGHEHAASILPMVLNSVASSRGGEEDSAWRYPIDLIEPLRAAERALPPMIEQGADKSWRPDHLDQTLLGEDPIVIIDALSDAIAAGAPPLELTKQICHAAALRLARFALSNDVRDWFAPVHTFTHCNALHQTIRRCPSPEILRGIFHAAIAVYMDRFLNVPAAKLPGERQPLDEAHADGPSLLDQLLDAFNQRHEVETAATLVARYVRLGHPIEPLINTLVFAVVREDVDFHALQVVEAGVRQYRLWPNQPEGEHILVGITRYLASQCPTQRGGLQTAQIALRLHRGDKVYEEEG